MEKKENRKSKENYTRVKCLLLHAKISENRGTLLQEATTHQVEKRLNFSNICRRLFLVLKGMCPHTANLFAGNCVM